MAVSSSNSNEANWNEINNFMRDQNNDLTVRVIKDESGTRRVILDKDGLRTSPSGVDVYTATNAQLTFNSSQNVFKIASSGTTTPPTASTTAPGAGLWAYGNNTKTIAHGLGYLPIIMAYITDGSSYYSLPWTVFGLSSTTQVQHASINVIVDATNITIYTSLLALNLTTSFGSGLTIKYYLLQESVN
jgi:hypothetical protein